MPSPIAINLAPDGTRAEIALRGWIGVQWSNSSEGVAAQLPDTVTHITVRINSLGGLAHEGIALHNILKAHPAHVEIIVEGVAGSAASVVAMAGDEIAMYPNSLMMIHAVRMVEADDWGNTVETPEAAAASRAYNAALLATYAGRTGKAADELAALLAEDTWMTADEAIAAGFADRIEPYASGAATSAAAAPVNAALLAMATAAGIPAAVLERAAAGHIEPATSEGGDPQPGAAAAASAADPAAELAAEDAKADGAVGTLAEQSAAAIAAASASQSTPFAESVAALAVAAGLGDYAATWLLADDITTVEAAQAAIAQAREVRALCQAVGAADMAPELIRTRATHADARRRIASALAAADASHHTDNRQPPHNQPLRQGSKPAVSIAAIYSNLNTAAARS